ncbi:zinc-ribbon and DUF3426 domain-containing protein [Pseudomarimonas salicorniae]|uniref:Zinc-ribbon and DUF3426 domain-containing protein n=1 Tax=Pseudomarimonas salicorniae TaxID=2933270 RepID=A0ABT0GCG3_9GAMM|nr:zinc-ribbon and DUF3426 domain-containing protein [Lysobacter sp. CAU 1642]MCK7592220.1 zinc-ribbon and DUF3426 domain-containing protein [Lysobacter sp. CAU 1642]
MLTQCPHCATVYPVEAEQFLPSGGRVRCGVCSREFDALERLRHGPPEAEAPILDPELAERQGELFAAAAADGEDASVPRFAQRFGPRLGTAGLWWIGATVLAVVLVLQILLAERHRLATDPEWRAAYETLCGALGCSLPPWKDSAALQLLSREVGPHPSEEGGLLVTASLRNNARWAQPLPMVELTLADIDGQVVAMRRFQPSEYHVGDTRQLAPGQTTSLRLEIADPGSQALAFEFAFH